MAERTRQSDRLHGERRTRFVQVRMTPDEVADVDAKAEAAGLDRGTFIRSAINDAEVKPIGIEREMARERATALNMFGQNLNQLVRWINARPESVDQRALLTMLLKLEQIGRAILDGRQGAAGEEGERS